MTLSTPPPPCPDEGLWRAWLDRQPAHGPLPEAEPHLAGCPSCQATVDALTRDAAFTASALSALRAGAETDEVLLSTAEVAQARERLAWRQRGAARASALDHQPIPQTAFLPEVAHPMPVPTTLTVHATHPLAGRLRVSLSALAAAAVLTFAIGFTPQGQALATSFLAQFRAERIQIIPIDTARLQNLDTLFKTLENLGAVQQPGLAAAAGPRGASDVQMPRPIAVKTLAEASQQAGFTVKEPTYLPPGVAKQPSEISVSKANEARFTFSVAKARAYFQSINRPDVQLPAKYDGASLVVAVPAVALLSYQGADGKASTLMVGQAGQLQVGVESANGVTLDELRSFLLGLPGIPPDVAQQLRAIQDWQNTLPLPVPIDKVTWKPEKLAGVDGLILDDKSGLGSGALWQKDGRIFGVGGAYKSDEIRRVADGLR